MKFHVLGSGSKGNAAVVETGNGALLIDCGLNCKTLLARCEQAGFNTANIKAAIITHEHSDHIGGLGVCLRGLRKRGIDFPVYVTAAAREGNATLGALARDFDLRTFAVGEELEVAGTLTVTTFSTSHDALDPLGMRIRTARHTLGYLTDTGYLTQQAAATLAGCELLALESNHDERMLACGPYPAFLKARVGGERGHLSNAQAAAALGQLLDGQLGQVVGMHLSEKNNEPHLPLQALQGVLDAQRHPARVAVAAQHMARSFAVFVND
jgi:phosphoribosyl 1,2-cyclic phosphodiesterase